MLEDDIGAVQEIERASCNNSWSEQTYRRELRNAMSSRYLVARASPAPPSPRHASHQTMAQQRVNLFHLLFAHFFKADMRPNEYPLIGYGGVWFGVDEAHITTIAVAPAYRGHGVGELLLNGLIDYALDARTAMITLEVRKSNTVAQHLYHKYGFATVGIRKRYYVDNDEDALIMSSEPINSPTYQATLTTLRQQLFTRLRAQSEMQAGMPENDALLPPIR
jgi:ribosomal-protein-alanine N-acetyltransferase